MTTVHFGNFVCVFKAPKDLHEQAKSSEAFDLCQICTSLYQKQSADSTSTKTVSNSLDSMAHLLLVTLRSPHSLDVAKERMFFLHISHCSQNPCSLLFFGDYPTQLYRDYILLSHYKDPY